MFRTLNSLHLLHNIIGDALNELDCAYRAKGLDYPSLEESGTVDEREQLALTPSLIAASDRIVAACDQLLATVRSPYASVCDAAMSFLISSCFRLTEQIHVVEILREAGDAGLHVDEIAARTNVDSSKLAHSLRLLATHHIFFEIRPDVFKNNRISSFIDTDKTVTQISDELSTCLGILPNSFTLYSPGQKYEGTDGMAAFVACAGDEFFKSAAFLTEAITDTTLAHSRLPNQTAFNLAWRTDNTFFGFLEQPENQYRLERFGAAIKATGGFSSPTAIIEGFPWANLPPESVIVDVGGGMGTSMIALYSRFQDLNCIIQEVPSVCALGENLLQAQSPQAVTSGRVIFQEHNFFDKQPIVNASVFYLRTVLHDWPDAFAADILLRLRDAATPSTSLVIADYILAYACTDTTKAGSLSNCSNILAPPPLLANLGRANSIVYTVDLNMHVMFNGQERTLPQLIALTDRTGWRITELRRMGQSLFNHVIAVPSDIPASQLQEKYNTE